MKGMVAPRIILFTITFTFGLPKSSDSQTVLLDYYFPLSKLSMSVNARRVPELTEEISTLQFKKSAMLEKVLAIFFTFATSTDKVHTFKIMLNFVLI